MVRKVRIRIRIRIRVGQMNRIESSYISHVLCNGHLSSSIKWNRLVHRINITQRLGKRGIKEPSDLVEREARESGRTRRAGRSYKTE